MSLFLHRSYSLWKNSSIFRNFWINVLSYMKQNFICLGTWMLCLSIFVSNVSYSHTSKIVKVQRKKNHNKFKSEMQGAILLYKCSINVLASYFNQILVLEQRVCENYAPFSLLSEFISSNNPFERIWKYESINTCVSLHRVNKNIDSHPVFHRDIIF